MQKGRASLPGKIVDCNGTYAIEGIIFEDFYTVLEEGSVWRWQYGYKYDPPLTMFLGAMGPVTGIVLGIVCAKAIGRKVAKSASH